MEKTSDKYQLFWDWFDKFEEYIFLNLETKTDEIAEMITENLKLVHQDLAFEISFEMVEDKRNFVISADGIYALFPTVIKLANSSKEYERWNIIPFRPRLHQENQVIELNGVSLDYDDIFFRYVEDEKEDIIHIDVFVVGYDGEDNTYIHTYFILLDSLIGEYDAVTKIGNSTMYPFDSEQDIMLYEFRDLIDIIDNLDRSKIVN